MNTDSEKSVVIIVTDSTQEIIRKKYIVEKKRGVTMNGSETHNGCQPQRRRYLVSISKDTQRPQWLLCCCGLPNVLIIIGCVGGSQSVPNPTPNSRRPAPLLTHSFSCLLTHFLTYSFSCLLTHFLAYSFSCLLIRSHILTYSLLALLPPPKK